MSQALGSSVPYYYSTNFKDNPYSYDYYLANQPQKNPAIALGAIGLGMSAIEMLSTMSQANSSKKIMKDALNHQIAVDAYNSGMQYDAYQYQQYLNMRQMEREDTAVQRRTEDLKAAGFNPILAAGGSGASSSPLRAGSAPQDPGGRVGAMQAKGQVALQAQQAKMEALVQSLGIARTLAEIRMMDTQKKNVMADTDKKNAEAEGIRTENAYKDDWYRLRNENLDLENKLRSGTLKFDIDLAQSKLNISKKEELIKVSEMLLNSDKHALNQIDLKISELIRKGKLKENEILDKRLELLTTEVLQKSLDYSNSKWDTDYYHGQGIPNNFNASWVGQLGQWLGSLGYKNHRDVKAFGGYFAYIKRLLGIDGSDK